MAITKILHMKEARGSKGKHLKQALSYIQNGEKTENGKYVSAINCQSQFAYEQMMRTKEQFYKTDKRQGYHIIISFEEGEITADKAFEFSGRFAREYLGKEYQAVYTVHTDTAHIHGHIVFNSVSFLTGRKYRYEKGDWAKYIQPLTNRLCEEYGLSTIKIEEDRTREEVMTVETDLRSDDTEKYMNSGHNDWVNYHAGRYIWSDMIRRDLDACILLSDSFESFLSMLRERGYEVKQNKYLALKPPGMQRFRRCRSLGENYTEDMIRKRIEKESVDYERIREDGEPIPATVLWVKVPYHLKRAKLTGMQRKYFAKLYRVGLLKKRPYSQAWRYREEIRKMHRLHDQYMFLAEHDIHDSIELESICEGLDRKLKEVQEQKRTFYIEKNRFKKLFLTLNEMNNLRPGYQSYMDGDHFFEEEYNEYFRLNKEISEQGYTYEQLKDIQKYYLTKGKSFWKKIADLKRETDAAREILDDMKKQELQLKEQEEDLLAVFVDEADARITEIETKETMDDIKKKEADVNAHDIIR